MLMTWISPGSAVYLDIAMYRQLGILCLKNNAPHCMRGTGLASESLIRKCYYTQTLWRTVFRRSAMVLPYLLNLYNT